MINGNLSIAVSALGDSVYPVSHRTFTMHKLFRKGKRTKHATLMQSRHK